MSKKPNTIDETSQDNDPYDVEARTAQKDRKDEKRRLAAYNRVEDLRWLMATPRGRRFIYQLLERTGLRKEPMTGNSQTFYNLGALAIGRELEGEIFAYASEQYLLMITENTQDE